MNDVTAQTGSPELGSSTTSAASAAAGDPPKKPAFPPPAATPTELGPMDVRFDFNHGARVLLPQGNWRVMISDDAAYNVLFDTRLKSGFVTSTKKFFVPFKITIWSGDDLILEHRMELAGRRVLISLPVGTIGDTLGWFPYVLRFARQNGCTVTCAMAEWLIPLFQATNPEIICTTHEAVRTEDFYASYNIGLFFQDDGCTMQPTDFRFVGLHRTAAYILGISPEEERPRLDIADDTRPIEEKYICIAVQASTHAKKWNNPHGWHDVVAFAKEQGYRVICIDKERVHGSGAMYTHIPHGVEDETGNRPLAERARWLKHADAFIGVSSGLAWLAWSVDCPVVLVSGFTHPTNEFHTEGRVINWHACNSCWNDKDHLFDHKDYLWCPRHKGTDRQYECSRLITGGQVKDALQRVLRTRPGKAPVREIG